MMRANLSRLSVLLLLTGCAAADPPQQPTPPPASPAPIAAADCADTQPWNRASKVLNRPVVQSGAEGKPVYTIRGVSYVDILNDHDLTGGVKLIDPRGREPAPAALYNIVWTPDEVSCTARYSAPTFVDMH